MRLFIFVIFSIICLDFIQAKIRVNVTVDNTNVKIDYSGIETKVVTSEETKLFKITKKSLRDALNTHYGRKPNSVYLKSPTPWGDLYKKYNWEQVTRILTVKSARVKNNEKKPIVIMAQDFENYSNKTVKVNTGISQTVENSVTTSWSKSHEWTVSQQIEYDFNVIFAKLSGTTSVSYTSTWGESLEKTETISIGTTTSMETELAPGQAARAVLSANRGSLELEVVYVASLRGNVAVNFKNPYNGHHFLGPQIGAVMKSGDLSNKVTTTETIRVGIYMDASLKVYDKETGLPL